MPDPATPPARADVHVCDAWLVNTYLSASRCEARGDAESCGHPAVAEVIVRVDGLPGTLGAALCGPHAQRVHT